MNDATNRAWVRALESLRYDITRRDPLQAYKELGERHTLDVTLDTSGQIRLIVTRATAETKRATRRGRTGRAYQVFAEQNTVTIINYRLQAGDDLTTVLTEMEKEIA